ncbi:hypothetical protein [Bifidobacterium sp. SO1]|uniref:hypothetical protein n=1 Tax=Bifidobacterium sp. SO1 TaxID=2809029 RepID=UPI001BDC1BC3|nr:hypothetical protein [Bifidobacterium sp. SO1]MBT1161848.1 hypothetical protein [Bifidobacterium sp. SO1]
MSEWTPKPDMSGDPAARDELDRHVKSLNWDAHAIEYGSRQRLKVAEWLHTTDLVYGEMRRLYPIEEQRQTMTRWVGIRIFEKITGMPIESKSSQWNWNGLWDPTENTSFCGWVRRLAVSIAQWNAKRVLKNKTVSTTTLEHEDGYNPAYDRADSTNPLASLGLRVFDEHPDLHIPRPVEGERDRLMRLVTDRPDATGFKRELITCGLWDHSLEPLDDQTVAALMLAPIPLKVAPLMEHASYRYEYEPELLRLYWPTQTSRRKVSQPRLREAVSRAARQNRLPVTQPIITDLGTVATLLALG